MYLIQYACLRDRYFQLKEVPEFSGILGSQPWKVAKLTGNSQEIWEFLRVFPFLRILGNLFARDL